MKSNFALRTMLAAIVWLTLQNFNVSTIEDRRWRVDGLPAVASAKAGHKPIIPALHSIGGKGTESNCARNYSDPLPPTVQAPGVNLRRADSPPAYHIRTVVLDAGHGGKDPGCSGASAKEKENALAIVLKLGELISASFPNIKIIYTRDTDVFIELNERAAIANRNNADLFISVHCNAMSVPRVHGTETYVLGVNRTEHNLEVAKRENAVISLEANYERNYGGYDPNSPEAHILSSVWQSAYLEQSIFFASLVQEYAQSIAGREDKGVKQAGFLVLRETAMPSVLVECGYLTNKTEEEFIASEEGRAQMAESIYRAFESYKTHMEGGLLVAGKTAPAAQAKSNTAGPSNNTPVKTVANRSREKPAEKPAAVKTNVKPVPSATAAKAGKTPLSTSFRIFLLSWPKRLDPNAGQLSLLGDIKEEQAEGKFNYYTGRYASRAEADKMLSEIKNLGFKTASIVPVEN